MTLDEKVGQMTQVDRDAIHDKADIAKYFLGSLLSGGDSNPPDITAKGWAKMHDEYQAWALKTRLRIPLVYGIDAVHGHNHVNGAVIFPHNIGLGATREPGARREGRPRHGAGGRGHGHPLGLRPVHRRAAQRALGPHLRELRRVAGAGCELLGAAAVRGLQGKTACRPRGRAGLRQALLRRRRHHRRQRPGQHRVRRSHAAGDPSARLPRRRQGRRRLDHGLLQQLERQEDARQQVSPHRRAQGRAGLPGLPGLRLGGHRPALRRLQAGHRAVDQRRAGHGHDPQRPRPENNYLDFIRLLKELVAEGRCRSRGSTTRSGASCWLKLRIGLFAHPFPIPALDASVGSAEHRAVARECVRQSLVLLKNENHALPLAKHAKRLVVVGKAADDIGIQCGGWTIDWQGKPGNVLKGGTTILAAIRQAAPGEVIFSANGSAAKGTVPIFAPAKTVPLKIGRQVGRRGDRG